MRDLHGVIEFDLGATKPEVPQQTLEGLLEPVDRLALIFIQARRLRLQVQDVSLMGFRGQFRASRCKGENAFALSLPLLL